MAADKDRWTLAAEEARTRSQAQRQAQRQAAFRELRARLPWGGGGADEGPAGAAPATAGEAPGDAAEATPRKPNVAVVGASLSGLVAAFRLKQAGANVTVFETRARARGSIETRFEDGFLWEEGIDECRDDHPCVRRLVRDLQLEDAVAWPTSRSRDGSLVMRGGRPSLVPSTALGLLTTPLVSPGGKLRALAEPLVWQRRRRRRRMLSWKESAVLADDGLEADDESSSAFLERHFGKEAARYLVEPLLAVPHGANAASVPAAVALPHLVHLEQLHGSLVVGMAARKLPRLRVPSFRRDAASSADGTSGVDGDMKTRARWEASLQREAIGFDSRWAEPADGGLRDSRGALGPPFIPNALRRHRGAFSFEGGMVTLPRALIMAIGGENMRVGNHVVSLDAEASPRGARADTTSRWRVRSNFTAAAPPAARRSTEPFDAVVVAAPIRALRDGDMRITEAGRPVRLGWLPKVERDPLATLTFAFKRGTLAQLPRRGTGISVPECETSQRCLGMRFASELYPRHAPEGFGIVTVYLGGSRDPTLARGTRIEQVTAALKDLRACIGLRGSPVLTRAALRPHHSLSSATGGALDVRTAIAVLEDGVPGLYIAGEDAAGPETTLHFLAGERAASRALVGIEAERKRAKELALASPESSMIAERAREDMLERRRARWASAEEMLRRSDAPEDERRYAAAAAFNATQSLKHDNGAMAADMPAAKSRAGKAAPKPDATKVAVEEKKVWGRKELPKTAAPSNVRNILPPGHESMSESEIAEWRRREEKRRARKVAEEVRRELLEERLVAQEQRLRMREEMRQERDRFRVGFEAPYA